MKSQQLHQFVVRHTTRYWWKLWKKSTQLLNLKKKKARRSLIKVMNDNCSAKQIINISIHSSFMMLWASWYSALQLNSGSVVMCHFFHHTVTPNNFFLFPLAVIIISEKKNWLQKITDWNYSKLIPASICHEL